MVGAGKGASQGEGLEPLPKRRGVCMCVYVFGEGIHVSLDSRGHVYAHTSAYVRACLEHMCVYAPHVCVYVCMRVDLLMATCI